MDSITTKSIKRAIKYVSLLLIIFFPSCASAPLKPAQAIVCPTPNNQVLTNLVPAMPRHNVCHIVGPGETLWRIGKMYDVKVEDIMSANNLHKNSVIIMGQQLAIPNAAPVRPVIPLYDSDKWKYIIIHHSATDEGDAFSFYNIHLKRGFWNGLGYDFVIDNGTNDRDAGQIEISPRWIKQQNGAHCKAGGMNEKGIGICLVGNFSKENVSDKQMQSLVYLVDILQRYYNIPDQNIMGHGQVPGAATECPGDKFPWQTFWEKLRSKK